MADYTPPTENLPIFDPTVFISGDEALTYNIAVKKFLRYPNAQGTENFGNINVNGLDTHTTSSGGTSLIIKSTGYSNNALEMINSGINQGVSTNFGFQNTLNTINMVAQSTINFNTSGSTTTSGSGIDWVGYALGLGVLRQYVNSLGSYIWDYYNGTTTTNILTLNNSSGLTIAPPISSTYTIPSPSDSSTRVPTTQWVQSAITSVLLPTGSIIPYSGVTAPTGFLLCDGSNVSTTTYSALYAVIGTIYSVSPPAGTFTLPNLLSKIPMGSTNSGTQGVLYYTGTLNVLGVYGGNQTMNSNQIAGHTHPLSFPTTNYIDNVNTTSNTTTGGSSTRLVSGNSSSFPSTTGSQNTPSTQADLLPPYCAVTYIIKY